MVKCKDCQIGISGNIWFFDCIFCRHIPYWAMSPTDNRYCNYFKSKSELEQKGNTANKE